MIPIRVTLRIPGTWNSLSDLQQSLPDGFQLTEAELFTPDGNVFDVEPKPADDHFFRVFQIACRQPATPEELERIANYKWNICLSGLGGTSEDALKLMQAASAIIRAGGAGVFIDNSAMAHGGKNWLLMTEDAGIEALAFAFVNIAANRMQVRTVGLHVLGRPEVKMRRQDAGENGETMIEIIQYVCSTDRPIEHGHIIADLAGPRFRITKEDANEPATSPTENPFGSLTLVSTKEIAESN